MLFEYDRRFERAYPDEFVFYDYKHPTAFGNESNNSVRRCAFIALCLLMMAVMMMMTMRITRPHH